MPIKPNNLTLQNDDNAYHHAKRFFSSKEWKLVRKIVLSRNPLCICGQIAVDVDHIIPRSILPQSKWLSVDNLRGLCKSCHNKKTKQE
jgi:5-methylcytosine-specific restriction endonuclease McrA